VLDRLLTMDEAADRLGTSVRFVRRLILERRIAYTKLGRHVRIAPRDLDAKSFTRKKDAERCLTGIENDSRRSSGGRCAF
jgi:excisionase family DNA binding protein